MLKMVVQRGRSERRGESYSVPYVEPLSDARTKLADIFSVLPDVCDRSMMLLTWRLCDRHRAAKRLERIV
jgi:hypothetical protein